MGPLQILAFASHGQSQHCCRFPFAKSLYKLFNKYKQSIFFFSYLYRGLSSLTKPANPVLSAETFCIWRHTPCPATSYNDIRGPGVYVFLPSPLMMCCVYICVVCLGWLHRDTGGCIHLVCRQPIQVDVDTAA